MTNQDVIIFLNQIRKILLDDKSWLESTIQPINEAFDKAISALKAQDEEQREEPLYCDSDICLRNEYNGIGCEECEVTKSQKNLQQVTTDTISRQAAIDTEGLDEEIRCEMCRNSHGCHCQNHTERMVENDQRRSD